MLIGFLILVYIMCFFLTGKLYKEFLCVGLPWLDRADKALLTMIAFFCPLFLPLYFIGYIFSKIGIIW